MTDVRVFCGTETERDELMRAITRHCACAYDDTGAVVLKVCGPHDLLSSDITLKHMIFARRRRMYWMTGEWPD